MALHTTTFTLLADGTMGDVQYVILTGFSGTDSFKLTFNGVESAAVVRGTNYDAPGIKAAIEALSTITALGLTVTVTGVSDAGFTVTFSATPNHLLTVTSGSGVTGVIRTDVVFEGDTANSAQGGRLSGRGPYTLRKVVLDENPDTGTSAELLVEAGRSDAVDDYNDIIFDTSAAGTNDAGYYPGATAVSATNATSSIAGTYVPPIFYGPVRVSLLAAAADSGLVATLFYEPRGDQRF